MEQESNEQEPNEATEIVGGKVETVEVSKYPEASIPETDLSLADIERRRSHPLRWALIILAVLCAIIAPYWFGRSLAVNNTDSIVAVLGGSVSARHRTGRLGDRGDCVRRIGDGGGRLAVLAVVDRVRDRVGRRAVHRGTQYAQSQFLVFHVRGLR